MSLSERCDRINIILDDGDGYFLNVNRLLKFYKSKNIRYRVPQLAYRAEFR